jgi:hypothetical protein
MSNHQSSTGLPGRRCVLGSILAGLAFPALAQNNTQSGSNSGPRLRHIGSTSLAHRLSFADTVVGGLSGIDYDRGRDVYYAISDDRSQLNPARFYTLKLPITATSVGPVQLMSVTTLQSPQGGPYPNRSSVSAQNAQIPDPESIRYRRDLGSLYWTSEGDADRGDAGFIREMRADGSYSSTVPLPAMYAPDGKKGIRDNLGLEAMAFSPDEDSIWFTTEAALVQDGSVPTIDKAGGPVRLTQLDMRSGALIRQFAYVPDAIPIKPQLAGLNIPAAGGVNADNGVSEIWMASEAGMLVLERAWARGVGNSIRLYWVDLESGEDVSKVPSLLDAKFKPVDKVLLLDFAQAGVKNPDNVEGMTRGPNLLTSDGKRGNPTLVFVSDDNFSSSQTTWFHAFEWIP